MARVCLSRLVGFVVLLESHPHIAKEVVNCLCYMINNQPKLVIRSEKAILVKKAVGSKSAEYESHLHNFVGAH